MAAMVEAGQVKDITDAITPETKQAVGEAALTSAQIEGKTYAVPVSILPGGLWYSKDLFKKAGVSATPTTIDELKSAATKDRKSTRLNSSHANISYAVFCL